MKTRREMVTYAMVDDAEKVFLWIICVDGGLAVLLSANDSDGLKGMLEDHQRRRKRAKWHSRCRFIM
jgi:hypothetical protein